MKSLGELRKEKDQKMDQLVLDCGMFFAFSNEQFSEGVKKSPLAEGDKYVSIGSGGYMPKSKAPIYVAGIKRITLEFKNEVEENKQRKANILHELNNHECFYIGEIEDALDALGPDYSAEEVLEVFNAQRVLENN